MDRVAAAFVQRMQRHGAILVSSSREESGETASAAGGRNGPMTDSVLRVAALLVAFLDAGKVRPQSGTLRPGDLVYDAGPGLRCVTPVGPPRLDFRIPIDTPRRAAHQRAAADLPRGDSFQRGAVILRGGR
jgi:hypothetical protein